MFEFLTGYTSKVDWYDRLIDVSFSVIILCMIGIVIAWVSALVDRDDAPKPIQVAPRHAERRAPFGPRSRESKSTRAGM